MKIKINYNKILFGYSLVFIILNLILGFSFGAWKNNSIALLTYIMVLIYLILKKFHLPKYLLIFHSLLNLICYVLINIIWLMNLLVAKSVTQIILGIIYTPVVFYFGQELIDKTKILFSKLSQAKKAEINQKITITKSEIVNPVKISDKERREFLKMIGSAGLGLITLSLLNPKKAGASFFGSVPGPGTISIKDVEGNKIDPAARHPTDGYKISKLDDTTSDVYSYYGFVDQSGRWYIQRETTSGTNTGDFLYCNGPSGFSTAWSDRDTKTYESFDTIF